ncbi:RDD family protein [Streptomyces sp. NPDC055078]
MSAPTPAGGDGSPAPGYYPDPSIPGYVRYWNGASWVPGTSRPAPKSGEAMPATPGQTSRQTSGTAAPAPTPAPPAPSPAGPAPSQVEETGPVFLDEEPSDEPSRPEPATAWQANTSRQTGFGGERDNRVSWGGQEPRVPGTAPDPRVPVQGPDPTGGALPGVRPRTPGEGGEPAAEGAGGVRPATPAPARAAAQPQPQVRVPSPARQRPPAEGTMAIRAQGTGRPVRPDQAGALPAAPPEAEADQALVVRSMTPPAQPRTPDASPQDPVTAGPGGGSASWAQQVHRLAQPGDAGGGEPPVVPWKPPADDPFLQAAQAHAAARPAPLGKRFAARVIDTLVLGALVGAVAVPVVSKALAHVDDKIEAAKQSGTTVTVWLVDGTTAVHLAIVLGALLVLGVLYETVPTAKWGRTLGKKLCGLTVVDIESHGPPSFGAALRRWLVYSVLGVVVVGVVNVLWCLFDRPWRQCWHDKAAHTFVTRG